MRVIEVVAIVVFGAAAFGCTAGQLGGSPTEPTASPGTVTLRALLPASPSYCDVIQGCSGPGHVSIGTEPGNWLGFGTGAGCAVECSTCGPAPCPKILPIACPATTSIAVTNLEATWDGGYVEWSTCGGGTACYRSRFVPPGRYYARMCATPGTLMDGTCAQTSAPECVDITFDLPGPSPVVVPLIQIMGG
jgi:hypothetical protein